MPVSILWLSGGGGYRGGFVEYLTSEKIVRFVLTSSPLFYSHLCFLYALIYSYGMLYAIGPKAIGGNWKRVYVILALVTFTLLSEVLPAFGVQRSFTAFHIGIHNFFLLRALPFIIMGLILRENSNRV